MKKSIWIGLVLACLAFGPAGPAFSDTQGRSTATAGEKKMAKPPDETRKKKADAPRPAFDPTKKTKKIVVPGKDLS